MDGVTLVIVTICFVLLLITAPWAILLIGFAMIVKTVIGGKV